MRKNPALVPTIQVNVTIVDVALPWLREDHRGNPLPEVDWRFHVVLPTGAEITFSCDATADDIALYLQRDGETIIIEEVEP